jgi:hypothetical protein
MRCARSVKLWYEELSCLVESRHTPAGSERRLPSSYSRVQKAMYKRYMCVAIVSSKSRSLEVFRELRSDYIFLHLGIGCTR